MALSKCNECGGSVSTSALTCPHCGAPTVTSVNAEKRKNKIALWGFFGGGTIATIAATVAYYDQIFGKHKETDWLFSWLFSPLGLAAVFLMAGVWTWGTLHKIMNDGKDA
jgi:hypothetical protein